MTNKDKQNKEDIKKPPETEVKEDLGQNVENTKDCEQCAEYLAGWQRAKADFINYQKEEAKRFSDMANYTKEMIIGDLLIILDSFELALMAEKNNEGLERIKSQLEDTLKRYNLEKIKASKGVEFDPALHESIGEQEDNKVEPGKVSAVVSSGYKLNDKVIRPVRVKLAPTLVSRESDQGVGAK